MEATDYAGAAQGMALATKTEADRPSEVFGGIEGYRNRLDRLESAVQRVYETFAAVIDIPPTPPSEVSMQVPRLATSTQVGGQLADANDRLESLISTLNAACGGSRL